MPLAPSIPWLRSATCIEPPLPPHAPVARPYISATSDFGSPPRARKCPWPRCVLAAQSPGRMHEATPTAVASCPIDRWTGPGSSPVRLALPRRTSTARINSIRRYHSASVSVAVVSTLVPELSDHAADEVFGRLLTVIDRQPGVKSASRLLTVDVIRGTLTEA